MKEVLTKKFWEDVKKTFYDAMEEKPAANKEAAPAPVEGQPTATSETPQSLSSAPDQQ